MNPGELVVGFLGNPVVQVLVFVLGPLAARAIVRRDSARESARRKPVKTRRVKPGFRDLRWGEAPRPEMRLTHDGSGTDLYRRRDDSLSLAGSPLNSILYSYKQQRLDAVMIELPGHAIAAALATLQADWGEGTPVASGTRRFWRISSGTELVQAILDYTPGSRIGTLVISGKTTTAKRAPNTGLLRRPAFSAEMEAVR